MPPAPVAVMCLLLAAAAAPQRFACDPAGGRVGELRCLLMARTLPEHDQDWSDVDRREEPPERVSLPAWGWLALAFVLAFYLRGPLATLLDGPALGTWTTIFVSISIQALPFLVLGVVLSGAITALVPPGWLARSAAQKPAGGGAGGRAGRGGPAGL